MITIPEVNKKPIAVYGLGVGGMATCAALAEAGAEVYCWDDRKAARMATLSTVHRAEHPKAWPWKALKTLVVSPGIQVNGPKPHPIVTKARAEGLEVIGEIELFARSINAMAEDERPRIVAVTGSNGKSTTAALLAHMLNEGGCEVYLSGGIGEAVLSLPGPRSDAVYVLALSSAQLELTNSLCADAAVFLNLLPESLGRYPSIDAYFVAKRRIFRNQSAQDVAIVNIDDPYGERLCTRLVAEGRREVSPVSAETALGSGFYVLGGSAYYNVDGKSVAAGAVGEAQALAGRANKINIAAAIAAAHHIGVAPTIAVDAAKRFTGLAHRLELLEHVGSVSFVNDSKASRPASALNAIDAFSDVYWIAGGRADADALSALKGKTGAVRKAYFYGEARERLQSAIGDDTQAQCFESMDLAVAMAFKDAVANGGVVLLAPACDPYDQFADFRERGEEFRRVVMQLVNEFGAAA